MRPSRSDTWLRGVCSPLWVRRGRQHVSTAHDHLDRLACRMVVGGPYSGLPLFYGGGFASPFVAGCGLAGLFYLLRSRDRLSYGLLELLAGGLLLGNAIYSGTGRGPFSSDFSSDFARFDPRSIALQSYAGLFILIRGLDNVGEGCANCCLCARMSAAVQRWLQ